MNETQDQFDYRCGSDCSGVGAHAHNLVKDLMINDGDIEGELRSQAALNMRVATLATQAERRSADFEKLDKTRYLAHFRTYGCALLEYEGQKETLEALAGAMLRLFSEKTTEEERKELARSCYRGNKIQRMTKTQYKTWQEDTSEEDKESELGPYQTEMYRYLQRDPQVTYEHVVRYENMLKEDAEMKRHLVKIFEQRSYCLGHLASHTKEMEKVNRWIESIHVMAERYPQLLHQLVEITRSQGVAS